MSPDQWKAVIIFGNAAMALLVSAWAVKLALSECGRGGAQQAQQFWRRPGRSRARERPR